ncbi:hypothetical protein EON63_21495 [archaeon]|nr:MAG: hypothetical protein EON63_21495 [archaeon]
MLAHAHDMYMQHAFPQGELRSVSCAGGAFELVKVPAVTLIDALDTLVVVGNYSEFRRSVRRLTQLLGSFDFDVNAALLCVVSCSYGHYIYGSENYGYGLGFGYRYGYVIIPVWVVHYMPQLSMHSSIVF